MWKEKRNKNKKHAEADWEFSQISNLKISQWNLQGRKFSKTAISKITTPIEIPSKKRETTNIETEKHFKKKKGKFQKTARIPYEKCDSNTESNRTIHGNELQKNIYISINQFGSS